HCLVSFILAFLGLFVTQFFFGRLQLLAVRNKKPLQISFLIRRVILFVVILNLTVGNLRGLLLQVLPELLRQHLQPPDLHQLFVVWSFIQTHLARFMRHDEQVGVFGGHLPAGIGGDLRRNRVQQSLELRARDHGFAICRFGSFCCWVVAHAFDGDHGRVRRDLCGLSGLCLRSRLRRCLRSGRFLLRRFWVRSLSPSQSAK